MLDKLKALLGLQNTIQHDALLEFALDTAQSMVLSYCNLDELPAALKNVVVRLAMAIYRAAGLGSEQDPQTVQSVKRGDVTTTFSTGGSSSSAAGASDFLSNFERELWPHRRLRW